MDLAQGFANAKWYRVGENLTPVFQTDHDAVVAIRLLKREEIVNHHGVAVIPLRLHEKDYGFALELDQRHIEGLRAAGLLDMPLLRCVQSFEELAAVRQTYLGLRAAIARQKELKAAARERKRHPNRPPASDQGRQ